MRSATKIKLLNYSLFECTSLSLGLISSSQDQHCKFPEIVLLSWESSYSSTCYQSSKGFHLHFSEMVVTFQNIGKFKSLKNRTLVYPGMGSCFIEVAPQRSWTPAVEISTLGSEWRQRPWCWLAKQTHAAEMTVRVSA